MARRTQHTTAARTLQLLGALWTPDDRVEAVVRAATAIADAEGLEAVTMRRVAEDVGLGTMTLYGSVPGRAELVELMLDAWAATAYDGHPLPSEKQTWPEAVRHVAERNWEHTLAHPWVVEVPPDRPTLGPGVSVKYDRELAAVEGIGLADVDMDHLVTTVLGMVGAAARWQIGLDRVRRRSGMSDEQWWGLAGPPLAELMHGVEVPLASRVGQAVGSAGTPSASMRWGLDRLLGGIARELAS